MWQTFTENARKVVFYAQEEAMKFGEGYVSTEHILLALTRDSETTAAKMFGHMGISPNRIRKEVEKQLPRGDARPSQDMTLTPRAKRVIDLSYEEARRLSDNFIGTEHLLLAVIREGDGLGGRVLAKLGVDLDVARALVLNERPPMPDQPPASQRAPFPAGGPTAFLMGASIQEHLMLALIAEGGKAADIIRGQVEHIGSLQWNLWQEIVRYANFGVKRTYPEMLPTILNLANKEANGGEVKCEHILMALLDPAWHEFRFGIILLDAGLTLDASRRLMS
jgi:hypothetical protein